ADAPGRRRRRGAVQLRDAVFRDPTRRLLDARATPASARGGRHSRSGAGDAGRHELRHRAVRLRLRVARRGAPVPGDGRGAPGFSVHGGSGAGSARGGGVSVQSINPATGEVLETFRETAPDALARILEGADAASREWRRSPVVERAERLRAAARVLRERKNAYARTMSLEMGKPLAQGVGEAEKCAWVCDYYADHGAAFLADEPHATDASRSYVRFEALGPVFAIMPWNFPFWQVFRFAAPALVAGNAGILKHAPNVPRCALEIETVFQEAGFPDGLFRAVLLSNEAAGGVIADQRVRAVTLTGSDRAGSQVAEQAGRHLKKTVLELGGSDPFIVLGGEVPAGRGAFYPPTVLSAVEPGMPAFDQETFGPVAAVIRAKDEADAIRMANASPYGLGASVWTADSKRGERVAREIEAGSVFVNGLVRSDPRLPFGGVKRSGYGRELSEYGLREFVNVKTVWVA